MQRPQDRSSAIEKPKVVILGNGAIGSLAALVAKSTYPNLSVYLVGPKHRALSASVAAGGMANVYAEVEATKGFWTEIQSTYLSVGLRSRERWREFFQEFRLDSVITADNTHVYLKKKASSFEKANYEAMLKIVKEHRVGREISPKAKVYRQLESNIEIDSVTEIEGEFAFCTQSLFHALDKLLLAFQIHVVNTEISEEQLDFSEKTLLIPGSSERISWTKLIVAMGARTNQILPKLKLVPMLSGVGTAIRLRNDRRNISVLRDSVIRTVNRGGAQCGLHVLPDSDKGIYLGAGNYITTRDDYAHRFETVRYLFHTFQQEISGRDMSYDMRGDLVLGLRPRSIDSQPMIGPLSGLEGVFIATGTNRVGLTWAPEIAHWVADWIGESGDQSPPREWSPERTPLSYGSKEDAIHYFVESRLGAAIEHQLLDESPEAISARKTDLRQRAERLIDSIDYSYGPDFLPHPDNWDALSNNF